MARREKTGDGAFLHSRERARTRYGVELSWFDYMVLCNQIWSRDERRARLIQPLVGGSEAWLVLHHTTWMVAIYKERVIVTFLPLHQQFGDDGRQIRE